MITVIACPGASSQFPTRSTSSPYDLNAMQCTRKPSTKPNATHHYQSWVILCTPSAPKPCMQSNHTENLREDEGVERSVGEGGKEEGGQEGDACGAGVSTTGAPNAELSNPLSCFIVPLSIGQSLRRGKWCQ